MDINKAQWQTEGDNIRLSMPLTKVDKENRLVSGWASLDNADSQGDIVLAEASTKAFSRFRGNIREMHQPIAVGKMVDFKEDSYYDTNSGQFYKGIYATVYVSKGAQDTWEKVLDGTLQGFSIGGNILDAESQFDKSAGKSVRFVKDYELVELSLVDSPANQLANIFSIQKAANGNMTMKGMVAETRSETVFYCETDGMAKTSDEESVDCANCGKPMVNIGWFEYDGDSRKEDKISEMVAKYHSSQDNAEQELPATTEGGVNVAEENVSTGAPTVVETVDAGQAETEAKSSVEAVADNAEVTDGGEEKAPEATEKAADVSEVEVEEPDFAKMFGELQAAVVSGLEKSSTETQDAIATATAGFEAKVGELQSAHAELVSKFDSLKTELAGVEKSLQAVESDTAVKKSGDLGGSPEDTLVKNKGSKWGGFFLGTGSIEQDN
jgi:hypothetical protein